MSKQEAIEKINESRLAFAAILSRRNGKSSYFEKEVVVMKEKDLVGIINQIDEPEKPVVPQFVADWIEVCKEHLTTSLYTAMCPNFMKENNQCFNLILWIKKTSNQYLFARAWLDGYGVEKKPIYVIRSKGTAGKYGAQQRLCYSSEKGDYFWCGEFSKFKHKFTRKELKQAGFGWVFDCEGVEVREVE